MVFARIQLPWQLVKNVILLKKRKTEICPYHSLTQFDPAYFGPFKTRAVEGGGRGGTVSRLCPSKEYPPLFGQLFEFLIMCHFECRLNRRFWRSKKVVQVVQIGER